MYIPERKGERCEEKPRGGEIIKLDPSPNSTHVNVFEMAGIDPKKVEENTKLINDLINSMKE